MRRREERVEPTDAWEVLLPFLEWPEQVEYELIRQPMLFLGSSVAGRAQETGTPERTLYHKIERFEEEGMASLFSTERITELAEERAARKAKRRGLEPAIRTMIADLKGEHPPLNNHEIAGIVYVRTGRRLGGHTVGRVLSEEVVPLKLTRLFEPYHQIASGKERRSTVVMLHLDGWSVKAISSYLQVSSKTVYRVIGRWLEEGEEGLEDRPPGRPKGVRKVDLATMNDIRRMQENPELGAFRIHAALEQKKGVKVSSRTVGRIMAVHRQLYGIEKPKRSPRNKKQMPFEAKRRHQIWTAGVRYIKKHRLPGEGYFYVISILENYSRCILASAVCRRQDLASFLPVLYSAIERYGSPETFVTDSGSIFLANRAQQIYTALGIDKKEIEKGKPWQSYIEANFNTQRKMAGHHFAKSESLPELVAVHDGWMADYNAQRHWAHEHREDGRHSPQAVLGFYTGVRYRPEDLRRAFFETRFARILDPSGYARLMHWRIYGEEGLAKRDVALWLGSDALTVEHAGEALSRYEADYRPGSGSRAGKLRSVRSPELFDTMHLLPQPRLFGLEEALGDGWIKAVELDGYAPRKSGRTRALQEVLFPYVEAI